MWFPTNEYYSKFFEDGFGDDRKHEKDEADLMYNVR